MRRRSILKPNRLLRRPDRLRVDQKWAWHYRTLIALRNHLVDERPQPAGGAPETGRNAGDGFDRDFVRALLAKEPDALGAINAAIERILHGTYGVCETTGQPIPAQRLRATPWLARCAEAP